MDFEDGVLLESEIDPEILEDMENAEDVAAEGTQYYGFMEASLY